MTSKHGISNRIRQLRFENGEMTQNDLACKVGLTRQTIAAIERGERSPTLLAAFQIAVALNTTLCNVFQYELGAERRFKQE